VKKGKEWITDEEVDELREAMNESEKKIQ